MSCQYKCKWLPGKTRLRNDLLCVELDVKLCSITQVCTKIPIHDACVYMAEALLLMCLIIIIYYWLGTNDVNVSLQCELQAYGISDVKIDMLFRALNYMYDQGRSQEFILTEANPFPSPPLSLPFSSSVPFSSSCLLYTSDAADE